MSHSSTQTILEHARQRCGSRGSRLTEKRRLVLAGLIESHRALSAYELLDYCRTNMGVELLPMSVYRILEFLEDENLVHRLNLTSKYVACSHIGCDHEHEVPQFLICNTCDRVEEIGIPRTLISSLAKNIAPAGFTLASDQLELNCVCDTCAAELEANL